MAKFTQPLAARATLGRQAQASDFFQGGHAEMAGALSKTAQVSKDIAVRQIEANKRLEREENETNTAWNVAHASADLQTLRMDLEDDVDLDVKDREAKYKEESQKIIGNYRKNLTGDYLNTFDLSLFKAAEHTASQVRQKVIQHRAAEALVQSDETVTSSVESAAAATDEKERDRHLAAARAELARGVANGTRDPKVAAAIIAKAEGEVTSVTAAGDIAAALNDPDFHDEFNALREEINDPKSERYKYLTEGDRAKIHAQINSAERREQVFRTGEKRELERSKAKELEDARKAAEVNLNAIWNDPEQDLTMEHVRGWHGVLGDRATLWIDRASTGGTPATAEQKWRYNRLSKLAHRNPKAVAGDLGPDLALTVKNYGPLLYEAETVIGVAETGKPATSPSGTVVGGILKSNLETRLSHPPLSNLSDTEEQRFREGVQVYLEAWREDPENRGKREGITDVLDILRRAQQDLTHYRERAWRPDPFELRIPIIDGVPEYEVVKIMEALPGQDLSPLDIVELYADELRKRAGQ